jgi:hypothetical protein
VGGRRKSADQRIGNSPAAYPINQVVAAVAASFVEKLLDGNCTWMGAYFDLDDGTLRCLTADPKTVAQIAGLHLNAVVSRSRASDAL